MTAGISGASGVTAMLIVIALLFLLAWFGGRDGH